MSSEAFEKPPYPLCWIEAYDPERNEIISFSTNNPTLVVTTVTDTYNDGWQIELLFKTLEQNLKTKTFSGTSPNRDRSNQRFFVAIQTKAPAVTSSITSSAFYFLGNLKRPH